MERPAPFCPNCRSGTLASVPNEEIWRCPTCGGAFPGGEGWVDLIGAEASQTGEHYSLQWGAELGFAEFLRAKPEAREVMPSAQLGWSRLLGEILERSASEPVAVYDAACGFGGIGEELSRGAHPALYVGADIHRALPLIAEQLDGFANWGLLLRWDISRPLPLEARFDYVLCRAAIHHTPAPSQTFDAISASLKRGGTIAISAYTRKSRAREAVDDALRAKISRRRPEQAFALSREFTALGRSLQALSERVVLAQDLPFLGIEAGEYSVHELVYQNLIKCFYNVEFGERFSTLVNYDWYHPEHAHRFDVDELLEWFERHGIATTVVTSTTAQHYVEGVKTSKQ